MFTVALLAQKGGVGKTTLAVTLAVQAELAGASAVILDADPQASASAWSVLRKEHGKGTPDVVPVTSPAALRSTLAEARAQAFDWLFLDTPAGVSELPATAAEAADLLLIPCLPSVVDMQALAPTVKLAKQSRKPAYFVVNRGRSKPLNDDCALALTTAYAIPAINTHIAQRLLIVDAAQVGLTLPELATREASLAKGKAEFRALWLWLAKQHHEELAHHV